MLKDLLEKIFHPEKLGGLQRSSKWPKVRDDFLKGKVCEVCGRKNKLELHHIIPFWKKPELELSESNLIILCDGFRTRRDHLYFGHLGSWKSWNENVKADVKIWQIKIEKRP